LVAIEYGTFDIVVKGGGNRHLFSIDPEFCLFL
jgi:hypothetical protein